MRKFPRPCPFLSVGELFLVVGLLCGSVGALQAAQQPPIDLLGKAEALPLAIDPNIQIRKAKTYFLESQDVTGIRSGNNEDQSILFERKHLLYGAITGSDIRDRYGDYFAFYWRAKHPGNYTVRLEYRQQKLGAYTQGREVEYPNARGSFRTELAVNGDDYLQQGRVSAWRMLIIQDHQRIVALKQSYLWR